MKVLSLLKPSQAPINHPQEDYFLISKKYPIFVVADGVSLNVEPYPKVSGAAKVAELFCKTVIKEAEKEYKTFNEKKLKEVFEKGNKTILEYNNSQKLDINYWDVDLFSATTSFLLIKDDKAYWWSLCDSAITVFNDKQTFLSPNGWQNCKNNLPKNFESFSEKEKITLLHKEFRNNPNGKGYGVVDGEESAIHYLNTGILDIKKGDIVFLFTDGFENYFALKEFTQLFKDWPVNIENKLQEIIDKKGKEDLRKYGLEKTIIAIS